MDFEDGRRTSTKPMGIDTGHLRHHLQHLCNDIGVRLAGTQGEADAASYCRDVFQAAGATVSEQSFPVMSRVVSREELAVRIGDGWESFPCSLFSNVPGTDGSPVEAPLVFFAGATEYARPDLSHLRGKAVVHLGCHIESREAYGRLMATEPAFLLFVDTRYPGSLPLADGMFPSYTRSLGARPTVNVAYQDAWRWKAEGADAARLCVRGGMVPGKSQNVIAELPGSLESGGILYLGAHHDTQAGSVGADDNATAVAGVLELARVLAPLPRKRTIRLVSFGAEEQLSVGSAAYVRAHRDEIARSGGLMFNMDSYGSHIGWTDLIMNGPEPLTDLVVLRFTAKNIFPRVVRDVCPYTDQFPFLAAGVPGVSLGRDNCVAGRFFHHRVDDDLGKVSVDIMADHLDVVAGLIADLANADVLPFTRTIPETQTAAVATYWQDLFGGW